MATGTPEAPRIPHFPHLPHIPTPGEIAGGFRHHWRRYTLAAVALAGAGVLAIAHDRGSFVPPSEPSRASDTLKPPSGPNNSLVSNPSTEATPSATPVPPTPTPEPSPTVTSSPEPPPKPEVQVKNAISSPVDGATKKDLKVLGTEANSRADVYLSREAGNNTPVHLKAVWAGKAEFSTFLVAPGVTAKLITITKTDGVDAGYLYNGNFVNPPISGFPKDVFEGEDIGIITGSIPFSDKLRTKLAQLPTYELYLTFMRGNTPLDAREFPIK